MREKRERKERMEIAERRKTEEKTEIEDKVRERVGRKKNVSEEKWTRG